MIKNVIFDFYGTLVDISTDEGYEGFFDNVEALFKDIKDLGGKFKELYLKKCKEKEKKVEEIELLDVFKEIYEVDDYTAAKIAWTFRLLSLKKLKIYPEVEDFLIKLKLEGYKVFLLSNAQRCFTHIEMASLNIEKYFDKIYLSSDYGVKKPNPKFFKILMNENNLNPFETIMIGNDANADIKGAWKVGLRAIYMETETSTLGILKPDVKGFDSKKLYKLIKKM